MEQTAKSDCTHATAPEGVFSNDESWRYRRHLTLPEFGPEAQQKLKRGRVLLIGAGGLGSPVSIYLAAAGVGTIGLVDFDTVDLSNLQRQILYTTQDIGRPKVQAARDHLQALNPHVDVQVHETNLGRKNVAAILQGYDVVVDGTDNIPTRYLLNDACVQLGIPNVHGSVFRFEGRVTVFGMPQGPCYRCLYPDPPPPELTPDCTEEGVLGVLPGLIGLMQANETIKLLTGIGRPLVGRLLMCDAWSLTFRELQLARNPECAVCGKT